MFLPINLDEAAKRIFALVAKGKPATRNFQIFAIEKAMKENRDWFVRIAYDIATARADKQQARFQKILEQLEHGATKAMERNDAKTAKELTAARKAADEQRAFLFAFAEKMPGLMAYAIRTIHSEFCGIDRDDYEEHLRPALCVVGQYTSGYTGEPEAQAVLDLAEGHPYTGLSSGEIRRNHRPVAW